MKSDINLIKYYLRLYSIKIFTILFLPIVIFNYLLDAIWEEIHGSN